MRSQNLQTETIQATSTHALETSNAMNHMINALGPLNFARASRVSGASHLIAKARV